MREPDVACRRCRSARKSSTITASCGCRCARIRRNSCAPISPRRGILRNEALRGIASGARATISGLVTCRQRPGSANGVVFMTIEDESAVANVIVWPKVFERLRPVVLGARYVSVRGKVQEECGVIHVVAERARRSDRAARRGWPSTAPTSTALRAATRCAGRSRNSREARAQGGRESRLARLMREMPELAADLDVPARGSAHAPTKRASLSPASRRPARH